MKIITKYSKSKNVTNVEDISQQDYIDNLKLNQLNQKIPQDFYKPFTFAEWLKRNVNIATGEEKVQYDSYLKNWYSKQYKQQNINDNLEEEYKQFLSNLSLTIEDNNKWIKDMDWNSVFDLEQAIPIYCKKLKEIAIYLIQKREALKKAKLKYNMVGSFAGLERLFYEYLLNAFTKRNYVLNVPALSTFNSFPDLSSVSNGFKIQIEELYDDTNYLDRDINLSPTDYFTLTGQALSAFYEEYYNTTDLNWLFNIGVETISADNPLLYIVPTMLSSLPTSSFTNDERTVLNDYYKFQLSKKYLGEELYILSGGYYSEFFKTFEYNLKTGNNYFYFPSGETISEMPIGFDAIALTSTSLIDSSATAAQYYKNADRFFIQQDDVIKGAWLKLTNIETSTMQMSCVVYPDTKTFFKFPFPGFGVSGEDLDWTGKQLNNLDKEYYYLDEELKKNVNKAYWDDVHNDETIKPISIHKTTFVDNGATKSLDYENADKVITRATSNPDKLHDDIPNEIYNGETNIAWLYDLQKTDIPLKIGQTSVYFPIMRYTQDADINFNVLSSQCDDVYLSSVNPADALLGCRAGTGLFNSDIIYKLDGIKGNPIECAWLSGKEINNYGNTTFTSNATGVCQTALTLNCKPNIYTTFLWTNISKDINNTSIVFKNHQKDCEYLFLSAYPSINEKTLKEIDEELDNQQEWKRCNCKSALYSPIGHNGTYFDNYNCIPDFIILNDSVSTVNLVSWKGTDGLDYRNSRDFAWYKVTANQIEKDIGYGNGRWVNYNGSGTFILSAGHQYSYYRTNLRYSQEQILNGYAPELIIKENYNNTALWMKADLQADGSWLSKNEPSDMIIKSGDFLLYDHINSNWYCVTGNDTRGVSIIKSAYVGNPTNSIWSDYTFATSGKNVTFQWPDKYYNGGPSKLYYELSSVKWTLWTPATGGMVFYLPPTDPFVVNLSVSGIYCIDVIGYPLVSGAEINLGSLPYVTCVPYITTAQLTGSLGTYTNYMDTINFIANIPLENSEPLWCKGFDDDSYSSKYKGTMRWGGGINVVDKYTFVTQPSVADLMLSANSYIEIYHKGNNNLTWVQPVDFIINNTNKEWCKLEINNNTISPLSTYMFNISTELVVSATNEPSDIILYSNNYDDYTFANYWAIKDFTWTQNLSNSTFGQPPTGGIWHPILTGELIKPLNPYLNILNRHYPTVANVPYIGNLYSVKDSGGYYIPQMLGLPIAISKNTENILSTELITNNENERGLSAVFKNTDIYISDIGLTKNDQIAPVSSFFIDSRWMKADVTEQSKAGSIINSDTFQTFMPYQTKYETLKINDNGIVRQGDVFDPWFGDADNEWENKVDWPANFKGQVNIQKWYDQFINIDGKYAFQWKTDIFGNQYALLKDINNDSIYDKRLQSGFIVTRNTRNIIQLATISLSTIYNDFYTLNNNISTELAANVLDFDIFYDTLMFKLSSYILLSKIDFNYDTGEITSSIDNSRWINLSGAKFGGTWFFDEDKKVVFSKLNIENDTEYKISTKLYNLDINTNDLTLIYDNSSIDITYTAVYGITGIEEPVLTYDNIYDRYNITLIANSSALSGMVLTTWTIQNSTLGYVLNNYNTILPIF